MRDLLERPCALAGYFDGKEKRGEEGLCALQAISPGKKKPHEGEEAPGEGGKKGREEDGEGEKEEMSTIVLNNALAPMQRQSTNNVLLPAKAVLLPLLW